MRGRGSCFIRLVPALAIGASALVFAAPGASASTAATFTLNGGSLLITEPGPTSLGSAATGALTLSGSLGTVTVTDTRGALAANWTASVISTNFTTGTSPGTFQTVTAASIAYASGADSTVGTPVGTFTPGVIPQMSSTTGGVAAVWAGTGNNTVSWNPTLTFTLSPSQVAGTYSGTVTHSVA